MAEKKKKIRRCEVIMSHESRRRMLCGWRRQRHRPSGGFRLKTRRRMFVHRLRVKLLNLVRSLILCKWKFSFEKAVKLLKKGTVTTQNENQNPRKAITRSGSTRSSCSYSGNKKVTMNSSSSRSYDDLSSFYAEAISDCVEFIRMSITAAAASPTTSNGVSAGDQEHKSSDGTGQKLQGT